MSDEEVAGLYGSAVKVRVSVVTPHRTTDCDHGKP
jgi:hypothetical protein